MYVTSSFVRDAVGFLCAIASDFPFVFPYADMSVRSMYTFANHSI